MGRKTDLAEQRILAGTEGREMMTFGRRGGNSGGLKDVMRLHREKNEKVQNPART